MYNLINIVSLINDIFIINYIFDNDFIVIIIKGINFAKIINHQINNLHNFCYCSFYTLKIIIIWIK